jgi:hypothetical protein
MSAAAFFMSKLEGVREMGRDRWVAICPAHEDHKPSLSVKQVEDRTLIHCWAGCGASDVVASLGLSLADLFDDRLHHSEPNRPPLPTTKEILALIEYDVAVFECTFADVLFGVKFTGEAQATAYKALQSIRGILGGCYV